MNETRYITVGVLAGAYKAAKTLLTHTMKVDAEGRSEEVLCDRVDLDNLADEYSGDADARPTCPVCARRDPRFR